jgi:eukaryotic-like serine/threonine-protein kinase
MANTPICLRCGSPRRYDAPGGVCPACLLDAAHSGRAAAADDANSKVSSTSVSRPSRSATASGTLQTLAGSFGPVPRVMLRDTDDGYEGPVVKPTSTIVSDALGRYQMFGEIARGGMGAVFKGRDPDLGRDLAVKVLLEQHSDTPDLVRRFVEEAQIAAPRDRAGL